MKSIYGLVAVFTILGAHRNLDAQVSPSTNFVGAESVVRQAAEGIGKGRTAEKKRSPEDQLRADLKAFQLKSGNLSPNDAAKQWLALLDRFVECKRDVSSFQDRGRTRPLQGEDLVKALPSPESWPELEKAVEARPPGDKEQKLRELGLRLLVHSLQGNEPRRREDLAAVEASARGAKASQKYVFDSIFRDLRTPILMTLNDTNAIVRILERDLAEGESVVDWYDMPSLVDLVGTDRAEAVLRKVLVNAKSDVRLGEDPKTRALARKVALELVDKLRAPQWGLVDSLDATELFEAMQKKFSKSESVSADKDISNLEPNAPGLPVIQGNRMPGEDDYERGKASVYYLLGLIAHKRTDEAVKFAATFQNKENTSFPEGALKELERAGYVLQLNDFFCEMLKKNPELPFWEEYVTVAAHAGRSQEMVALLRQSAESPALSKGQKLRLRLLLHRALFANDNIDEGVAELRQLIRLREGSASPMVRYDLESRGGLGIKLAKIGRLLGHLEWVQEGIAVARAEIEKTNGGERERYGDSPKMELGVFLAGIGRSAEAEALWASDLTDLVGNKSNSWSSYGRWRTGGPEANVLAALVRLYCMAGRNADTIYLFDSAPWWGAKDVMDIRGGLDGDYNYYTVKAHAPVSYYLATALAKSGRKLEARKILEFLLDEKPGCDRLYELLLDLERDHAPEQLDTLFARDQFEERPLIWKAHWLREHGKLAEAEQAARKAISIDPTDGEEPAGDRLRAYSELAIIRAAQGDKKESEFLTNVVEAVHQAEQADQLHEAGLLKRAADMYQESLKKFADAYCIHARLAVRLSEMGFHEQAQEHYRRAYELMPDSFGRMESYCFGCEKAFDGERAQSVAEKVFTELAQKTPNKPQVHYLLGYLREEQGRSREAIQHYHRAVELDPDYINAWEKMLSIGARGLLSGVQQDEIVLNLIRLDPFDRHGGGSFQRVSNLKALWRALDAAHAKRTPLPESLYPLAASKTELEKQKTATANEEEIYYADDADRRANRSPGAQIGQNGFIRAAMQLIGDVNFGEE